MYTFENVSYTGTEQVTKWSDHCTAQQI